MSSIDKFIDYVIESYAASTGKSVDEVRGVFVSRGVNDIIRRCPSPFISHGQAWRNKMIEKQLAHTDF
ncbi:MAG: hypothetical protein LBG82_05375 [Clostridiales Family XIII bacterium]|jgi:hypothetical protein|nr:hypothetical protein [Clostridiales Family XIII bacterium]